LKLNGEKVNFLGGNKNRVDHIYPGLTGGKARTETLADDFRSARGATWGENLGVTRKKIGKKTRGGKISKKKKQKKTTVGWSKGRERSPQEGGTHRSIGHPKRNGERRPMKPRKKNPMQFDKSTKGESLRGRKGAQWGGGVTNYALNVKQKKKTKRTENSTTTLGGGGAGTENRKKKLTGTKVSGRGDRSGVAKAECPEMKTTNLPEKKGRPSPARGKTAENLTRRQEAHAKGKKSVRLGRGKKNNDWWISLWDTGKVHPRKRRHSQREGNSRSGEKAVGQKWGATPRSNGAPETKT